MCIIIGTVTQICACSNLYGLILYFRIVLNAFYVYEPA